MKYILQVVVTQETLVAIIKTRFYQKYELNRDVKPLHFMEERFLIIYQITMKIEKSILTFKSNCKNVNFDF